MSFLNSVLSSINTGKGEISKPSVIPAPKREAPATNSPAGGTKRKASTELPRPSEKLARNVSGGTNTSHRPKTLSANANRTSHATPLRNGKPEATKPPPESKSAPKKGSLKEIMARAKQNSTMQVGQLTHKPKEKVSIKKELAQQRDLAKQGKQGKGAKSSRNGATMMSGTSKDKRSNARDGNVAASQKTKAKIKPPPTYQGTAKARPSQPAYRGTMMSRDAPPKTGYDSEPGRERSKPSQTRRGGYSDYESEEEFDSEDQYDYASDDYSDMDAGFDDVDEEEAAAERQAKKEDIREQKKLEELARQKEEKKRRAKLAADREKTR